MTNYNADPRVTTGREQDHGHCNLTSDSVNSYTWYRANRLLSMGGVDYQYDGEGRRVQQTISIMYYWGGFKLPQHDEGYRVKITELWNIFFLVVVLAPIIMILSVYSLRYHVALYEATSSEVDTFIKGLFYPLKIFYSLNKYGMYYNRPKYSAEQIASSLYTQRLFVGVLPLLFIGMSVIVTIRMIPTGNILIIRYILILIVLPYFFRAAWRFGINIKQTKSEL